MNKVLTPVLYKNVEVRDTSTAVSCHKWKLRYKVGARWANEEQSMPPKTGYQAPQLNCHKQRPRNKAVARQVKAEGRR